MNRKAFFSKIRMILTCGLKIDYSGMKPGEIRADLLSRIKKGRLVIPDGLCGIPDSLFDGKLCKEYRDRFDEIVSVHIPGTVRRIGKRAFAGCRNLEKVIFDEGVRQMDSNAFNGCEKLKSIRLPASIEDMRGWTFWKSGIDEPVLSSDGKTLYYYPQKWDLVEYTIPEGVEVIADRAFTDCSALKRIVFPKTLKRISSEAICGLNLEKIEIPAGVEVEKGAIAFSKRIPAIRWAEEMDAFSERRASVRCIGGSFLARTRCKLPENRYWKEEAFVRLSQKCAEGDVQAMERMTEYFENLSKAAGDVFFLCAAHFWRMRAYLYGSEESKAFYIRWCEEHPNERPISPFLDEDLCGSAEGEELNALGFMFFDEDREYSLGGVDDEGVVEASAWESEDGPDEDGFGREMNYDWWYLNEFLLRPEGVDWVHGWSNNDKRSNEEMFSKIHDSAAKLGPIRRIR